MRSLMVVGVILLLAGRGVADQFEVELVSGEMLTGTIVGRTPTALRLQHDLLGELEVPVEAIRSLSPNADDSCAPAPSPSVLAVPEADLVPVDLPTSEIVHADEAPLPDTEILIQAAVPITWTQQFELGFNGQSRTVSDQAARVSYRAERHVGEQLFRYDATYKYAARGSTRTENALTAGVYSSWPSRALPLNGFFEARFDHAEFQPWDQRFVSSGGFEYTVLALDHPGDLDAPVELLSLSVRGGGGFRKEFGSTQDDVQPEALVGGDLAWKINARQRLSANSTYLPSLRDRQEYRLVSGVDWTLRIDELDGVNLRLGMAHEYQSRSEGPAVDDLSVFATIVFSF